MPQFRFCSISWEPIGRISPNFIYAFILERSSFLIVAPLFLQICTRVMALYLCWNFVFHSISWELTIILSPNFIYAFILIRSSLGLLHVIFGIFVPELWPLNYAKILFPFNILRTNSQNFTKFYICIHIDKICVGIVTRHFSHICTRVIALDLLQNFVYTQYLENKWTEFDQPLYNYLFWQALCWDC